VCGSRAQALLDGEAGERWTGSIEQDHSQGGAQTNRPSTVMRHGGVAPAASLGRGESGTVLGTLTGASDAAAMTHGRGLADDGRDRVGEAAGYEA
jgi:hypothetical protein